ncbi:TIGR03089 family protein [Dactylosporangium sp. NPDC051484]|uniref:TIGR03089 family protein n=1 Tax=Dactylosporangium sp. NPDC051484 TaxID=3154942 RepID=UPI00344DD3A4
MSENPVLQRAAAPAGIEAPLLTYCDDATGERTELSATELGGWAARAAGLLREGCGLGAGDRAAVLLPPHWLTAAALLGAWSAGIALSFRGRATAGLPVLEAGGDGPFDATFVAADRIGSWLEDIPAATHQFAFCTGSPPEGYRDFRADLAAYSPHVPAYGRTRGSDAASVDGISYGQWGTIAAGIAERLGLRAGDRLLVDAAEDDHPVKWLLAPLSAGASVVVCANATKEALRARAGAEGISHTL